MFNKIRSKYLGSPKRKYSGYGSKYGSKNRNRAAGVLQRFFRRKTYSSASATSRRWRPGSKLAGYVRMRFNRRAALQKLSGIGRRFR